MAVDITSRLVMAFSGKLVNSIFENGTCTNPSRLDMDSCKICNWDYTGTPQVARMIYDLSDRQKTINRLSKIVRAFFVLHIILYKGYGHATWTFAFYYNYNYNTSIVPDRYYIILFRRDVFCYIQYVILYWRYVRLIVLRVAWIAGQPETIFLSELPCFR